MLDYDTKLKNAYFEIFVSLTYLLCQLTNLLLNYLYFSNMLSIKSLPTELLAPKIS